MNKVKVELKGSENYLNVVGGFIRHAFFFKKKAFKFIGLKATFTDTNEKSNVGSILGTELPQAILLRLNTIDLSLLEKYVIGTSDNESIKTFEEDYKSDGISFKVSGSEDMLTINVNGTFNRLKTSDMSDILGDCPDFDIYSSIESRPLDITFYLRYDCGHYTYEENLRFMSPSESFDFVSVDTIHKYDCNFGYSVEGEYLPQLYLNLDESIDVGKMKEILTSVFADIQNAF